MRIAAKTDAGTVRTINEDDCNYGALPEGAVWVVVCDGMGGANAGNVASQTAVQSIAQSIRSGYRENLGSRLIKHLLITAVDNANTLVFNQAAQNEDLAGMGTTVVAAILTNERIFIAHAGDSRVYLCREDHLLQLTRDHSVVQVMLDHGQITEDEAKTHPRKNLITRALGVHETLDVDYCEESLLPGDVLLICTDGLPNALDPESLPALIAETALEWLPETLVHIANENGAPDNITVFAAAIE